MTNLSRTLFLSLSVMTGVLLWSGTGMAFDKGEGRDPLSMPNKPVKSDSRWSRSFAFDNDILVPGSRDQDYTYGLNLTLAGSGVEDHWTSLHEPLAWLDQHIGLDQQLNQAIESNKIEYGLFGFTPEDISQSGPGLDDRPYAGLVYVSSTKERYDPARQVSWQSTLTVGVIGLGIVGDIQDWVHAGVNGDRPQGWQNQISDGGEPTARYSVARQSLMYKSDSGLEIKTTTQGSVGYLTEASWSLSLRAGKIHTPWVSFNPELTSYGEKSIPGNSGGISEHYFWTGFSLKARAYNVFLQGQFKDSPVTYDADELNHGIVEAWVGYSVTLTDGYGFSYSIRGHSSELRRGVGDRNVVWGGLQITKTFI